MEKLTDKVQYSDAVKLSEEEIKIVNMLADKEPSCYADIAAIMIEYNQAKDQRIKELENRLDKINDNKAGFNEKHLNNVIRNYQGGN